jgi:hypothetical protein
LSSFSQTDTSKVKISSPIAKLVIKDLIIGDGCELELNLTREKIIKLQEREAQKDTIISLLKDKGSVMEPAYYLAVDFNSAIPGQNPREITFQQFRAKRFKLYRLGSYKISPDEAEALQNQFQD